MTNLKKILLTAVLLCAGLCAKAYDFEVNGIYYNKNSDGTSVSVTYKDYNSGSYNSYSGIVTIPSVVAYDGISYSVTAIGDRAFYGCESLVKVTMPNSIKSIGQLTFVNCISLENLTIPNSITSIGYKAFENCTSFTKIVLPNNLTTISNSTFYGCSNLTEVTIPNTVTTIEAYAFGYCSKLKNISLPPNITSIPFDFARGSGLENLYIHANISYINEGAFREMDNLKSITVDAANKYYTSDNGILFSKNKDTLIAYPCAKSSEYTVLSGVKAIKQFAFHHNYNLTKVTLPSSITYIGQSAFYDNQNLIDVIFEGTTPPQLGSNVFNTTPKLKFIKVPNASTYLNKYDFKQLTTQYTDPKTIIDDSYGISMVTINNITYGILDKDGKTAYAITVDTSIIDVKIDSVITGLGNGTDEYNVTTIGVNAFNNCSYLKTLYIPNGITKIQIKQFSNCSNLEYVYCNAKFTTYISDHTSSPFYNCGKLKEIVFGDDVTSIPSYLMQRSNTSLHKVVLGKNLKFVGLSSFGYCHNLDTVYIGTETMPDQFSSAFHYYDSDHQGSDPKRKLFVPCGFKQQYANNNSSNNFAEIIEACDVTVDTTVILCQGSTFNLNGKELDTTGIYTDTVNLGFSDSIINLNLTVNPVYNDDVVEKVIYEGDSYSFAGKQYANAGYYTETLQTINGCDSIVSLKLFTIEKLVDTVTVHDTTTITIRDTIINNIHDTTILTLYDTVTLHDTIETTLYDTVTLFDTIETTLYDTVTLFDTIETTLYDTVMLHDTIEMTLYDTVTLHDTIETTLYDTVTLFDTIETTLYDTVTLFDTIETTLYDTVTLFDTIETALYDTVTLFDTIETTLYDTVTLHDTITVTQTIHDTVNTVDTVTVTEYDTVTLMDTLYLHDTITPCGITRTYIYAEINAGETYMGYGFTESDAGEYTLTLQTEDGCDSIVTLYLQVTAGIDEIQQEKIISIYPNPAHDRVTIHADGDIKIIDNKGQVIREIKSIKGVKDINVSDFEAGVYYINVGKFTQPLIIE
ncbi:MAG: leucine-rich repeat domain-containing protein [Bacteroidales bacterium]|nr:leucine-rich repeat domain-containing protein [Bacteroidales bacterium]